MTTYRASVGYRATIPYRGVSVALPSGGRRTVYWAGQTRRLVLIPTRRAILVGPIRTVEPL